jgi:hypothetical protein
MSTYFSFDEDMISSTDIDKLVGERFIEFVDDMYMAYLLWKFTNN